jgi:hypothetical protein
MLCSADCRYVKYSDIAVIGCLQHENTLMKVSNIYMRTNRFWPAEVLNMSEGCTSPNKCGVEMKKYCQHRSQFSTCYDCIESPTHQKISKIMY